MKYLRKLFRGLSGISLVSVITLFRSGPGDARRVISSTLLSYSGNEKRKMSTWDMVRGFAVNDEIKLFGGHWTDGCISALERYIMAQLIKYFKPDIIVEIGTFRGSTTRVILDNMEPTSRVYTVDLPADYRSSQKDFLSDERLIKHRKVGADYADHPLSGNVVQILGDTFEPATWEKLPDNIDFVFIDASHSYEAVHNDTDKIRPKLKNNAVVLWHDYTEGESMDRGVGKYIREMMKKHSDVFVCENTSFAIRIPENELKAASKRIPSFFPDGSYAIRHPDGATPWLNDK
ncbi:MAG: hypothetical protein DRH10_05975 [Deltaproteobacteria bacterium]|nr:MAG: hypothetical protein DRH10_05975 [Deltaproteobacteria bacterium]